MKRFILAAVVVVATVLVVLGIPPSTARAEGALLCTVTVSSNAVDTHQPFTDGGTGCVWPKGAVVAMQCPALEVCYNPAVYDRVADGGRRQAGAPIATTGNVCVDFTVNKDPYVINLGPTEQNISLITNFIADAGTFGTCKFARTLRRQP